MDARIEQFKSTVQDLPQEYLAVGSLLVVTVLGYLWIQATTDSAKLPPGPSYLIPWVGNALQIPSARPWYWYRELADKYGPVFSLKIPGTRIIVVTGEAEAKYLLETRGASTASRPRRFPDIFRPASVTPVSAMVVPHKYASNAKRILFLPYGDAWRQQRSALHKYTMPQSALGYAPLQMVEMKQTMNDLLDTPDDFDLHFKRYTASVVLKFTYGLRAKAATQKTVVAIDDIATRFLSVINFGPNIVELLPLLDKLPDALSPWRVKATGLWQETRKLYGALAMSVKDRMKNDEMENCFCKELWENQKKLNLDDDDVIMLAGSMFEAGTDTTANQIRAFIAAAVIWPDVIKKGQEELQRVLGDDLPTLNDLDRLPYVRALVKETLRWRTVAPNGAPHLVTQDETVNGYLIPKGSYLVFSIWANHMDSSAHKDPDTFNPDRYMEDLEESMTQGHNGFGKGRRLCVGLHLATRSMFLIISRLLWTFDFAHATDPKTGKPYPIEIHGTGMNGEMDRFRCKITPRSPERAQTVRDEWLEVKDIALSSPTVD